MTVRKLTRAEVPDGTIIGWASDVHIPIHHEPALRLMCEAWEWAGVTHIVAGGDILDMHCISRHAKDPERLLEAGTIAEEIEPGRWFLDFLATRPCALLLGNHEDRLRRFYIENGLPLVGDEVERFRQETKIPAAIEVLPQDAELRLGSFVMTHGHLEFPRGGGGKYPAHRLLDMSPGQSSACGHVHRQTTARRTAVDEHGVPRTWGAWTFGHMSIEAEHLDYAGRRPNWQVGFGLITVHWENNKPRWDVTQTEVMFDRRRRPYFSLWGRRFQ